MSHLREALLVRLQFEGNRVTLDAQPSNLAMKTLLKSVGEAQKMMDAEEIAAAEDLTYSEVLQIEQKEATSPEEAIALTKYYLKDFYGLDSLSELSRYSSGISQTHVTKGILSVSPQNSRNALDNLKPEAFPLDK